MLENRNSSGRATGARRILGLILCAAVFGAALAVPSAAFASNHGHSVVGSKSDMDTSDISPAVDVLILRPIGVLTFITGVALVVPASIITALTRPTEIAKPFRELVVKPARYVWVDPLGEH